MIESIEKLVDCFFKHAQETVEVAADPNIKIQPDPLYLNHVIRINQQADVLKNSTDAGVNAGTTRPEAKRYTDSFKNLAVRLTGIVQGSGSAKDQQEIIKQLFSVYNTIEDNYIDYRWDPMKKIRESMTYVAKNMPQIEGSENTELPPV